MSYWTFSDVFEEQGVVKTPFYGGFGLIAAGDIPKPVFYVFKLLHNLGDQRIEVKSDSALVTRKKDGALELAVWNLVPLEEKGSSKTVVFQFKGVKGQRASVLRVDREHGDVHAAYEKMGSPRYPMQQQIKLLRESTALGAPETREIKNGELELTLPPDGLAVVEVR